MKHLSKILFPSLLMLVWLTGCQTKNPDHNETQDLQPVVISLWEKTMPPVTNGLAAGSEIVENPGWISSVTDPELYVYLAENPNGKALLMCPGGGYSGVAIAHEGKDFAPLLTPEGITVAVLKYRMPNGHSQVPADDVWQAMKILQTRGSEWGINPSQIGIGGASAGGHLASTIATHPVDSIIPPAFQVLLYPVISMKDSVTHQGSRFFLLGENPDSETVEYYSNETQVGTSTPPAFIAVSGNDDVVPVKNSIDYFNALNKYKIPVSMHIYPVGGHGWGTNPDFPYSSQWKEELISWLSNLK